MLLKQHLIFVHFKSYSISKFMGLSEFDVGLFLSIAFLKAHSSYCVLYILPNDFFGEYTYLIISTADCGTFYGER